MPLEPDPGAQPRLPRLLLYALPLLLYATVALLLGLRHREMMNADAMCYIRRAMYLLDGDFYHFVSEHWSLMLSWFIAPLMAMGVDGLYAARIITACIGAIYLIAFIRLSERLLTTHWIWRLLLGLSMAPFLATVAIRVITPDQLLATWLLIYFLIVLDPNFANSPRRQFFAGLVAGFAYLAKAFALPFFLAHLLMTLFLYATNQTTPWRWDRLRQIAFAYGRALVGFLLIASFWIAAISWKYGHFSAGSSGAAAHGVTGNELEGIPTPGEAMKANMAVPPGPYVSPFETPEKLFPRWNPFASRENFHHQLLLIRLHAGELRHFLSSIAHFYLVPIGLIIAILILPLRSPQRWKILWLLLTLAIFLGPFLLVVIQHRYLNPHIVPLSVLLCLILALEWRPAASDATAPRKLWRCILAVVILVAFSWSTYQWTAPLAKSRTPKTYRLLAQKIHEHNLEGPFACDSRARGILVAYHAGHKYVGFPLTQDVDTADRMLREIGVRYLINFDTLRGYEGPNPGPEIVLKPGWEEVLFYRGATVYRFTGATTATSRPTTRPSKARESSGFDDVEEDLPRKPRPARSKKGPRQ